MPCSSPALLKSNKKQVGKPLFLPRPLKERQARTLVFNDFLPLRQGIAGTILNLAGEEIELRDPTVLPRLFAEMEIISLAGFFADYAIGHGVKGVFGVRRRARIRTTPFRHRIGQKVNLLSGKTA